MASSIHELILEVFRLQPWLGAYFASRIATGSIRAGEVEIQKLPARLNQVKPVEFEADAAFLLGSPPYCGLIVEVQLAVDRRKQFSWPYYASALRARIQLPVELLVVTPFENVERWGRTPIQTNHANDWRPLVLGPRMFATLAESASDAVKIHLEVFYRLLTRGHRIGVGVGAEAEEVIDDDDELEVEREVARLRQIDASSQLDEDTKSLYSDIILTTAAEAIRRAVETSMKAEHQQAFQRLFQNTYDRGVAKGVEQGVEQGVEMGKIDGLKDSIHRILEARGLSAESAQLERVEDCENEETLERWITQAVSAKTTDEALR